MRSYEQLKAWEEIVISSGKRRGTVGTNYSAKNTGVGYLEGEKHEVSRRLERKILES